MRHEVRVPQLGEAAAEATVVSWLVKPGGAVKADQEIVEVQTEKSVLTVTAPVDGVLLEQRANPGDQLKVGDVLAIIGLAGATAAAPAPSAAPAGVHTAETAPKAKSLPPSRRTAAPSAGLGKDRAALRGASGDSAFITPRVSAKLQDHGLKISDLSYIQGTGAGGRVTASDIDAYIAQGEAMPQVRQAVANAMTRSWSRPLATIGRDVNMEGLLAHRRTVAGRPSATIYGLRALAVALAEGNPLAARLYGSRLHHPTAVDLAVAVEIEDGVLTPVVRKVDQIPLAELTAAVEDVIDKARTGRINDLGEAVGTVSNYGVFGITWATPIPLPGQGLILGLGAIRNVPDWNPATKSWDRVRAAEITLTFDHRIADGGHAGRLLARICELLEKPERLG